MVVEKVVSEETCWVPRREEESSWWEWGLREQLSRSVPEVEEPTRSASSWLLVKRSPTLVVAHSTDVLLVEPVPKRTRRP